jgi:hypothetical protein
METTETQGGTHTGSSEQVDSGVETDVTMPQCEVTFGAGFTEPTKPYGNVKVFCSLKVQCGVGEQDAVFGFCEEWVNDKLTKNMQEIKAMYEGEE